VHRLARNDQANGTNHSQRAAYPEDDYL